MKRIQVATTLLLCLFLAAPIISSVSAKEPTKIEDAWVVVPIFVSSNYSPIPVSVSPDKVWTSEDGTVIHCQSTQISTYLAHTPSNVPAGTIRWGTVTAESNFVFDTTTSTGTLTMKIALTLTAASSSNPTKYPPANYPNTYGIGTLEGTLVAEVTSLNPYVDSTKVCPMPGAGQGHFVATHGTDDFADAKLSADVTLEAVLAKPSSSITLGEEFLFIGHHFNHLFNDGTIVFH